ncbi:MAG: AAA family ATPase [Elusimicrobia bacterium]|nr:AAA family ATPase [Elusimicrobiota bacterium]
MRAPSRIKFLKSVVAVIACGSLLVSAAAGPVAAQTLRAGRPVSAGAPSRAGVAPAPMSVALPSNAVLGSAGLAPALSPLGAAAPSAQPHAAAVEGGVLPEAPRPAESSALPVRLVSDSAAGPRKSGLRAAFEKYLPFRVRSGSEAFDGSLIRKEGLKDAPVAAKAERSRAPGLAKPAARVAAIVEDKTISTPEAARRVGEIRRSLGTPLWAKVVAPLSVAAAVAAALHFGAAPVLTLAAGLVLSVLAHELAHIGVLHWLGDHTAEHAGTHSFNPLDHIDAVKTVIVPALSLALSSALLPLPLLLGAGKPVDADFNNLRSPFGGPRSARNAFWVAAAGPAMNVALAALAFGAAAVLPAGGVLAVAAHGLGLMNLALAAFNMLPLPQLDGGKILASVLPERLYAKWVFNPKVERGYQGVFRRLYEGPSNVLTWLADALGVRTQKGVNRLANTATFAALAAFYAAAYFQFSLALPLLFLALPCSYDYWCIREKVRSEAAVQDLMEIMSQWGAVIVQIAEDLGLESEVSAYETEHAMKNALETLVDEMMAKEEFRALSDEQKLDALMKEYPDKAAGYLKDKAMPEDSLEKIKSVLADPRNARFYERLRKWFKEHEIFARWDNQHQQGKLKDAMKNADKPKEQTAGAPKGAALSALAALGLGAGMMGLFPDWAPQAAGLMSALGVLGVTDVLHGGADVPADPMRKAWADPEMSPAEMAVTLREGAGQGDFARVFGEIYYGDVYGAASPRSYLVRFHDREDAALAALRIARDPSVERLAVYPELYRAMALSEPAPGAVPVPPREPWTRKVLGNESYPELVLRATFADADAAARAHNLLSESFPDVVAMYDTNQPLIEATARSADEAAAIARKLVEDGAAASVAVSASVYDSRIATSGLPAAVIAPAPAAAPPAAPALPEKVSSHGKAEYGANAVLVKFAAGTSEADIRAALARHGQDVPHRHADMYTVLGASERLVRALIDEKSVAAVQVHPNLAALMAQEALPYPGAPSYDHARAIIVEFRPGATEASIKEYAGDRRLKLIHANFRGSERSALFEVPKDADVRATLQALVDETADAQSAAESASPFQEQPGDAPLKPAVQAAAAQAAVPEAAAPRRDPAQAWLEYLQNATLSDGKSKLTDKQIMLLSVMLRPLARRPDEPRPPIVSRNEEVKRMLPIVTSPRGMRNSVILIGEAGVGKTAVAEGLAEMIEDAVAGAAADGEAFLQFERLKGRWLVELDINKVLTQEDPVGVLSAILDLLPRLNTGGPARGNDVIVLMDEIQKFFLDNAGQKIANTLKGPLRDGKLSVIATTTRAEFKRFIESDDAFRRRFEKIDVEEPTVLQTIAILRAMKSWLQELHSALLPDEALVSAAKLADQFDKTNFNPDKAIKAVQDAAELSRPENLRAAVTLDLREAWGELVTAANEARQALADKGIASVLALPVDLYNKIAGLVQKAESLYAEREAVAEGKGRVTTEVVKRVIAAKTGIASGQLNLGEDDAARYTKMEEEIGRRVVNQDRALTAIANAVRRNKAGLSNPNRPMGKFLLTGPTGVGKTYLAKELARFLFNDPEAMIRMDMSEYMEEHTAQRLTGSPPGYVGYGEGGQLTEAVRKKPYSVLLFDEIEKAHPKVFDVLLQILDDGRLTDGQGRTVDFKNTVIILTSNAGMSGVDGEKYAKLLAKVKDHNEAAEINKLWDEEIDLMVGAALKERFRPEFLNRLDEDPLSKNKWIRVNRLRPEDIAKIAGIQLKEFTQLLADRHDTDIRFDSSVTDFLAVEGYSPLYGARPMTAAIEKHIIDPLAQWILKEAEAGRSDVRGALIKASYAGGKIVFEAGKKPEKNTARATVQGASEAVAAELFALIERLAGEGAGEEPSEGLFDRLMRKARPGRETAEPAAARAKAFFAPGAGLAVGSAAAPGEHNNSKKKDAALRGAASAALKRAAAAGWGAEELSALEVPAGGQGEGWLKQMIKLAKEQAAKAGAAAPVALSARVDQDAILLAVSGAYAMSEDDQRSLTMHFTGTPPDSYPAAQKKADSLNLSARLLWDHNLLDLHRRLAAIPGARMGFKTGPEGTQIWLELRREAPAPAAAPKAAETAAAPVGTPHQLRETAKVRELLMRVIDQSRLSEGERDGHAIRIAAAEGYALLAGPAEAAAAREWLKARKWGEAVVDERGESGYAAPAPKVQVGEDWPLAMTAALILERLGGPEDVELLENTSRRVLGTSHFEVPVHSALASALSTLYARMGLSATMAASRRGARGGGQAMDIAEAVNRALGSVGVPAHLGELKADSAGYLAMMKRLGRQEELREIFRDKWAWRDNNEFPSVHQAALIFAGETEAGAEALGRLRDLMRAQNGYSLTGHEMSRAWAAIVAREGLTRGLGGAIARYLEARGMESYDLADDWPVLYAYVATAALAGGADALEPLENILSQPPAGIASVNEQSYFSAPDAWARVLVRSGKFEEYARSRGLNADGSPKPSRLQEMLADQTRPMRAAAALRAIAYGRDPSKPSRPAEPKGGLPDLLPPAGI